MLLYRRAGILLLLLICSTVLRAQEKPADTTRIRVSGLCDMCKDRI